MKLFRIVFVLIIASLLIVNLQAQQIPNGFVPATPYVVEVINVYPHDTSAFTQGLLWFDGALYESTGRTGESSLRRVDVTTGEVLQILPVNRPAEELTGDNPLRDYFAEGLDLVDDRLIQLTWQDQIAFVYDRNSFEQISTLPYEGQGWGLCNDGRYFYMSDSSQYLAIRELDDFDLVGRLLVTVNAQILSAGLLNELECVGDSVYANLWQTDYIVEIDKFTGNTLSVIDASGLLTEAMIREIPNFVDNNGTIMPPNDAVLNGIAYRPETDTFFITGKWWPRLFEVRFVPQS